MLLARGRRRCGARCLRCRSHLSTVYSLGRSIDVTGKIFQRMKNYMFYSSACHTTEDDHCEQVAIVKGTSPRSAWERRASRPRNTPANEAGAEALKQLLRALMYPVITSLGGGGYVTLILRCVISERTLSLLRWRRLLLTCPVVVVLVLADESNVR